MWPIYSQEHREEKLINYYDDLNYVSNNSRYFSLYCIIAQAHEIRVRDEIQNPERQNREIQIPEGRNIKPAMFG